VENGAPVAQWLLVSPFSLLMEMFYLHRCQSQYGGPKRTTLVLSKKYPVQIPIRVVLVAVGVMADVFFLPLVTSVALLMEKTLLHRCQPQAAWIPKNSLVHHFISVKALQIALLMEKTLLHRF